MRSVVRLALSVGMVLSVGAWELDAGSPGPSIKPTVDRLYAGGARYPDECSASPLGECRVVEVPHYFGQLI